MKLLCHSCGLSPSLRKLLIEGGFVKDRWCRYRAEQAVFLAGTPWEGFSGPILPGCLFVSFVLFVVEERVRFLNNF
jgi:hypothetical protein